MADKKITQLTNITGANLVDADEFVVVDISADETKAITFGELKEAFDTGSGFVRITGDTMTGDLTVPNVITSGNVDGRDVSADGTKLDTIETNADVTDTTNVTAAGALMTSGGTMTGDVAYGDNVKATFGASADLQVYHDGSHSYIKDTGAGNLYLQGSSNIVLESATTGDNYIVCTDGAAVNLYYDNEVKLATTANGVRINDGTLAIEDQTGSAQMELGGPGGAYIDLKTPFSDDFDARMQYDGNSFVINTNSDQPILLKHNSSEKMRTTSTGIDVTGTVVADGLTVDGNVSLNPTSNFVTIKGATNDNQPSGIIIQSNWQNTANLKPAGQIQFQADDNDITGSSQTTFATINADSSDWSGDSSIGGYLTFKTSESNSLRSRMRIADNGDISFYEDTGTTPKMVWKSADERLGIGTSSPATTLDVAGTTTTDGLNLDAIAATIEDTAVDVFVYDTSKDSDGGAWRKRTQGTSWYNETLNTATRGSRKEFPAVAVIVAESTQLTIYDGDDPDMPMWAVLDANTTLTSVFARNGLVCPTSASAGVVCWNFVSETLLRYISTGKQSHIWTRDVTGSNFVTVDATAGIVSNVVNDVAMTVLPNAPIDASTGLPVPTIAVATAGGVSVIKDDGTVVDSSSTSSFTQVDFEEDGSLWVYRGSTGGTEVITSYASDGFTANNAYTTSSTPAIISSGTVKVISGYRGTGSGLNVIDDDATTQANGMIAYTAYDYATGWMNGDIKLATLSDTDDTNVTGSELVTNGTFDSDTSGWTVTNFSQSGGVITSSTANSQADQTITTVSGKTYTISFDIIANHTDAQNGVYIRNSNGSAYADFRHSNVTGSFSGTFTATGASMIVRLYNGATTGTISFDNISVRLAEEDRSVNGNGLQVFGTVTKSAVATGADLVAYSGFTTNSYLRQPYDSEQDFGTGDFSLMMWLNGFDSSSVIYDRLSSSEFGTQGSANSTGRLYLYHNNSISFAVEGTSFGSGYALLNQWQHLALVRRSGTITLYVNGEAYYSSTSTGSVGGTSPMTHIGTGVEYNNAPYSGSISLLRLSATAPSPDQILKIYNDEKHLFTEGAQATLYGSSDSVTALAYDTDSELLHVGTSAGRSVFQGLRRVDNTTTAVTSAISASNGLVADE